MDSRAILATLSTSTEKTQAYKDLYSDFLADVVVLHNYHTTYMTHTGVESSFKFRSQCMKMGKLLKKLRTFNAASLDEERNNRKITKSRQVMNNKAKIQARKLRASKRAAAKNK